jgi:hypothetical protein
LKQLQKEGGIYWEFTYRGKLYKVVFRMPQLFVICDTEGANKLCGKMKFTGHSVNHQCHYCDVSWDELSNPFCKFKYNVDKKFFDLAKKNKTHQLRKLSHYSIVNAFEGIDFGEDPATGGGIHRWTPAEVLHYLCLGLHLYAILGVFHAKKTKKKIKRKKQATVNSKCPGKKRKLLTGSSSDAGHSDNDDHSDNEDETMKRKDDSTDIYPEPPPNPITAADNSEEYSKNRILGPKEQKLINRIALFLAED